MINSFTEFNPLIMSILISVFTTNGYANSLVAIATAISLNGLGSGAANMGIVAACVTFLWFFTCQFSWCQFSFVYWRCEDDDSCLFKTFNHCNTINH